MTCRKPYSFLFVVLFLCSVRAKSLTILQKNMQLSDFYPQLFDKYPNYQEKSIKQRRFKHPALVTILEKWKKSNVFAIKTAGKSYQNRDIFLVKAGNGPTNVLLWSQMHGDEATATMALLDIFHFLSQNDELNAFRDKILSELTLYFVPMLNPDGAEVFERRTAQGIDMNRDAVKLQTPEARLLKQLQNELKPEFGFNLHDQNIRYTAGKTRNPATVSFLAPPIDAQNTVNAVRQRAIQLIVQLNRRLQTIIPDQVGRWSDEFEPRAFGENMQIWGTSTVLVESGGYANDPEKQYIRKLNFVLLLDAFYQIATRSYAAEKMDEYQAIPHNERYLFDLLIRRVSIHDSLVDIGINRAEKTLPGSPSFYHTSTIDDWGDLSVFYGYEELDVSGLQVVPGKLYPHKLSSVEDIKRISVTDLLKQGYLAIQVDEILPEQRAHFTLPIHIVTSRSEFIPQISEGKEAHFLLAKDGNILYAVVNGFLYKL